MAFVTRYRPDRKKYFEVMSNLYMILVGLSRDSMRFYYTSKCRLGSVSLRSCSLLSTPAVGRG